MTTNARDRHEKARVQKMHAGLNSFDFAFRYSLRFAIKRHVYATSED